MPRLRNPVHLLSHLDDRHTNGDLHPLEGLPESIVRDEAPPHARRCLFSEGLEARESLRQTLPIPGETRPVVIEEVAERRERRCSLERDPHSRHRSPEVWKPTEVIRQ